MKQNILKNKKRRAHRVRVHISKGKTQKLRLSVFRSNTRIYAQIIDDILGKTIVSATSFEIKEKGKKIDIAKSVGKLIAKKAKDKKISEVVFDRGSYKYHGRVKALSEGAREGGLKF